ncbi:MAG: cadherin-like domain-containing protein [Alphaproteobacteria bacterium]|nr:cadherin-like domain-containing protein [Alphaproteobacteria bacterium]
MVNRIDGTAGDDIIVGTAGADEIEGGAGRDRLNGGDGDDIVSGGDDNDYVYGDRGNDTLYGGAGNDALVGDSGDDLIHGQDGNDGVFGGGNNDTIYGGAGNDTLYGDGANDFIDGGADDDKLFGGSGNDTLVYTVGEGVDQLTGNTGIDTVRVVMTSADLDTARADLGDFAAWLDGQIAAAGGEAAHAGINNGEGFAFSSFGLTVSAVERVELIVDGETVALQDALNQTPVAAAEQTVLVAEDLSVTGAVGASDPDGDPLSFSLSEAPASGVIEVNEATGEFTYTPNGDFAGSDSFTVLIDDGRGGTFQQMVNVGVEAVADAPTLFATVSEVAGTTIEGTGSSETIHGTNGDDSINGGSGSDTIYGDGGNGSGVTVSIDIEASLTDADGSEALGIMIDGVPGDATLSAGTDLGGGSWQLAEDDLDGLTMTLAEPQDVTLTITATAAEANGSFQSVTQVLKVAASTFGGDDVIAGGAGNDVIYGGAGTDTVDYSGSGGGVLVNLGLGLGFGEGIDQIYGVENINGSGGSDILIGNSGNNVINGGAGNDVIDGGSGIDTASYAGAASGVDVDLQSGQAGGGAGSDKIANIENLVGSDHADELSGDTGDNVIDGGAGADTLSGGRGDDVLAGGAGADTFVFTKSDVVSGSSHYGVDRITDFGAGDRLDFEDLLNGVKYDELSDVIRATTTAEGTLLSIDIKGYSGFADVVFLEGVFDLDLDYLDGSGQLIV